MATSRAVQILEEKTRELDLFTDREDICFRFLERLNGDQNAESIMYLEGDGGNGKSLLLRAFTERLAFQTPAKEWKKLCELGKAECLVRFWANGHSAGNGSQYQRVPVAIYELPEKDAGNAQSVLMNLRKQLGGIAFPYFEAAVITKLRWSGEFPEHLIRNYFGSDITAIDEAIARLVDVALQATIGPVAALFDGHDLIKATSDAVKVDEKTLTTMMELARRQKLEECFPEYFARDIENYLDQDESRRVVVLIDTNEAFVHAASHRPGYGSEDSERWLRQLVLDSPLSKGMVLAVSGREGPRWGQASEASVPDARIERWDVEEFTEQDAKQFLMKAGITAPHVIRLLIEDSRSEEERIHPWMLALDADLALDIERDHNRDIAKEDLQVAAGPQDRRTKVYRRFLYRHASEDLRNATVALSVCRQFTQPIFEFLGQARNFGCSRDAFEKLVGYSFVRPVPGTPADGPLRLHELLKRVITETEQTEVLQCHKSMIEFYAQHGDDDAALVEIVYHAMEYDRKTGLDHWLDIFERGFERARYSTICEPLLELLPERDAISDDQYGQIMLACGDYQQVRSSFQQALENYTEAIAVYDTALTIAPTDPMYSSNKGNALQRRGDAEAAQGHWSATVATYTEAIAAHDTALTIAPTNPGYSSNKGSALQKRGDAEAAQGQWPRAVATYTEAIAVYDTALTIAPTNPMYSSNKGNALQRRGDAEAAQGQWPAAVATYTEAIAVYDTALTIAPTNPGYSSNKGSALQKRGDAEAAQGHWSAAVATYTDAIAAHDTALTIAPTNPGYSSNKGNALQKRGDAEAAQGQWPAAVATYTEAIAAHDTALTIAPTNPGYSSNKGNALRKRGDAEAAQGQWPRAVATYTDAIAAHDTALTIAPTNPMYSSNKGNALQSRGDAEAAQGHWSAAVATYTEAIAVYDTALTIAPTNPGYSSNKGSALQKRGDAEAAQGQWSAAVATYTEAIAVYDTALTIAPNVQRYVQNRNRASLMRITAACRGGSANVSDLLTEWFGSLEADRSSDLDDASLAGFIELVRMLLAAEDPCHVLEQLVSHDDSSG